MLFERIIDLLRPIFVMTNLVAVFKIMKFQTLLIFLINTFSIRGWNVNKGSSFIGLKWIYHPSEI